MLAASTEIAYMTCKVFPDGSNEIRIKRNIEITRTVIENARRTRSGMKILRKWKKEYLAQEILKIPFIAPDYNRKKQLFEYKLNVRSLKSVIGSARRARQALYDICRCNDFEYFITWTFDHEKVDRLNDDIVKRKFTQFQNYLRKMFPQMYYVAVPEYHKKGGLHFHLLVGGVSMEELKAVPARYVKRTRKHKKGDLIFKNGKQIFNVERWRLGYSTLSVIENVEAAKHYVCKYITKQNLDDRFFGKKRYYVSNNIRRPEITKWRTTIEHCMDGIDLNMYLVSYANMQKKFAVLTYDGNGVVNTELNSASVKKHMKQLATDEIKQYHALSRAATDQARATGAARDSAYSTIATLDRKTRKKLDWKGIKKRFEHARRKSLINFKPPHEDYNVSKYEEQTILDEYYANMAVKPCVNIENCDEFCREIGLID